MKVQKSKRIKATSGIKSKRIRGVMRGHAITPGHELAFKFESATLPELERKLAAISAGTNSATAH